MVSITTSGIEVKKAITCTCTLGLCMCNHGQDSAYTRVTIGQDHIKRARLTMQTDDQPDVGSENFQNSYEFGATGSSTTSESESASTRTVLSGRGPTKSRVIQYGIIMKSVNINLTLPDALFVGHICNRYWQYLCK